MNETKRITSENNTEEETMASEQMKAMMYYKFGPPDVLQQEQIDKPEISNDEVLIKTYVTSVNMLDIVFRSGNKAIFGLMRLISGIFSPKRNLLGSDMAGKIVDIGDDVEEFEIGDRVYGGSRSGANAEFSSAGTTSIVKIADNVTYEQAGTMPVAALSALQGLRDKGEITQGQDVLIYGASGGIGTYAVQLAKYFGATVTAVASGKNEELVTSLGADHFIDYTREDFTTQSKKYDLIFDAVGKVKLSKWKLALNEDGIFVNVGSPDMPFLRITLVEFWNRFRQKQYRGFTTKYNKSDLEFLAKLVSDGDLRSVIDKSYKLEDLADAHRYYEKGHTAGKIAIIVSEE